ncbi:MAG: winged helix-turn-helix domain-containing protein [Moorellaceae bacterium]
MRVRYKLWLEKGEHIFGEGLFALLREIEQQGSINKAAQNLHMSYRQAWGRIKKAEERLGFRLLLTRIGGEAGGGAELTSEGRKLLGNYQRFREEVERSIQEAFRKNFGE